MNGFASLLGINTSGNKTCFLGAMPEGIAVLVHGKEYFLRYADFPWFEYCNAVELRDMTADRWGVYWGALGIDLPLEALAEPGRFPKKIPVDAWLKARNRQATQTLGNIRSAEKTAASRRDGAKGGRPRQRKGRAPLPLAPTSPAPGRVIRGRR